MSHLSTYRVYYEASAGGYAPSAGLTVSRDPPADPRNRISRAEAIRQWGREQVEELRLMCLDVCGTVNSDGG